MGNQSAMGTTGSTSLTARSRSLRRNVSAALVGNVFYAGSQLGMLVAIAQLCSAVEVGRYALALAVSAPIFVFAGLKLRQAQVTDAAGRNAPGDYFGLRLLSSLAALGTVTVVALAGPFPEATASTIVAVGLGKAFEAQVDIYYGAMQRLEQLQLVAWSQAFRGVGGLVIFVVGLVVGNGVQTAAWGVAAFTALTAVAGARRVKALGVSIRPRFQPSTLRSLMLLTLPLGVAMVIASLMTSFPRYVIEGQLGTLELGVFAVLAYSLVGSGTVANALVEAAMPRLANLFAEGSVLEFKRLLWRLMALGAVLGTLGILLAVVGGEPALRLIFGEQYAANNDVLVLLAVAAALQYTVVFLGTSINAMRMFMIQMPINLLALGAIALASIVAIPPWGLMGAAVGVLAGEAVQALAYGLLLWRTVLPRLKGKGAAPLHRRAQECGEAA